MRPRKVYHSFRHFPEHLEANPAPANQSLPDTIEVTGRPTFWELLLPWHRRTALASFVVVVFLLVLRVVVLFEGDAVEALDPQNASATDWLFLLAGLAMVPIMQAMRTSRWLATNENLKQGMTYSFQPNALTLKGITSDDHIPWSKVRKRRETRAAFILYLQEGAMVIPKRWFANADYVNRTRRFLESRDGHASVEPSPRPVNVLAEATGTMTLRDLLPLQLPFLLSCSLIGTLILIMIPFISVLSGSMSWAMAWEIVTTPRVLTAGLGLLAGFVVIVFVIILAATIHAVRKNQRHPRAYQFTHQGLSYRIAVGSGTFGWSTLWKRQETKKVFCVHVARGNVHVIPKRWFRDPQHVDVARQLLFTQRRDAPLVPQQNHQG